MKKGKDSSETAVLLNGLKAELLIKTELVAGLEAFVVEQHGVLEAKKPDIKAVDAILQEKERLYLKIEKVDVRINEYLTKLSTLSELRVQEPELSKEIEEMMLQIRQMGVVIQDTESKCKVYMREAFDSNKESVKTFRDKKGVINQYSKNMSNGNSDGMSYFMDKKK